MPTSHTLKKISYNNNDVQVESAIRDGSGNVISSTYQTALGVNTGTATAQLSTITINGTTYEIVSGSTVEIIDLR